LFFLLYPSSLPSLFVAVLGIEPRGLSPAPLFFLPFRIELISIHLFVWPGRIPVSPVRQCQCYVGPVLTLRLWGQVEWVPWGTVTRDRIRASRGGGVGTGLRVKSASPPGAGRAVPTG
jgi:hypothetical protein